MLGAIFIKPFLVDNCSCQNETNLPVEAVVQLLSSIFSLGAQHWCVVCLRSDLCPQTVHGSSQIGAGAPSPAAEEAHNRGVHPWLDGVCARPGAVWHPALRGEGGLQAAWELPETQARWVAFRRWDFRSSVCSSTVQFRLSCTVILL